MNPITENLDSNDKRELPSERGPRGVDVETSETIAQAPPPQEIERPRSDSEFAQQRLREAEDSARRSGSSFPEIQALPEPALVESDIYRPALDPNSYTDAFTRERQDMVDAMKQTSGFSNVPTYAGSTYDLQDSVPPVSVNMAPINYADFTPPAPSAGSAGGSGQASRGFLSRAFEQYTDPAYSAQRDLNQRGLDLDPTPNALRQTGSGIAGVVSLARNGISSLFRASYASGQELVGKPSPGAGRLERAARAVGAVTVGGGGIALLNPNSRRAFMDKLKSSFSEGMGANQQTALSQISPTQGAGNAGARGPLRGDFGEYGSNLIGGVNYGFDAFGNQNRANINAMFEGGAVEGVANLLQQANPLTALTNLATNSRYRNAALRNARDAWNGKDFSFLNPDGPMSVFNPENDLNASTPFRVAAGVALDTVTGPDLNFLDLLRKPVGKAAGNVATSAAQSAAKNVPAPSSVTRTAFRPPYAFPPTSSVTPNARPPYAFPSPTDVSPSVLFPNKPPTGGGVNSGALFQALPNSPRLEDIRVLQTLPEVGTPDFTPYLPRPRRPFDASTASLDDALDTFVPTDPTRRVLDLRTGRVRPVVEPDLDAVRPPLGVPDPWTDAPSNLPEVPIAGDPWSDARPPRRSPWDDPDLQVVPDPEISPELSKQLDDLPDEMYEVLDDVPDEFNDLTLEELFAKADAIDTKSVADDTDNLLDLDLARRVEQDVTDMFRESGWDDVLLESNPKISVLKAKRGAIGVVQDTPANVIEGRFPQRPPADVIDIFTKQVREAPVQALEDVDLSRKVIEHSTAAGTSVVTDSGAIMRSDRLLEAGARQLDDLQNKVDISREAGDLASVKRNEELIEGIRKSAGDTPINPPSRTSVLTPDEVENLVPTVRIEQITPSPRAFQAVKQLNDANLLEQAFDLKAIERSNLVTRSREDLQALANWMGHTPEEGMTLSWRVLRKLHEKHGLYAPYGPAINGFELDRARRNGLRRIQEVEPNQLLNVPEQSRIITSTPAVLKSDVNRAVVAEQELFGNQNSLDLLAGKPLADDVVSKLVDTWVESSGRSTTRRNLNKVLGGGYQYTPDQVAALRTKYGALPKKEQAKLPKGLRDILKDPLPPGPSKESAYSKWKARQDGSKNITPEEELTPPLSEMLEPGVTPKQVRATSVPSELRNASDDSLAKFVDTRSKALDTREAIVQLDSDLATVSAEQQRIYQELATLPELEPRSVMDGNWDVGRVNERVETVLEVLDQPVVRRADEAPFTGAVVERGLKKVVESSTPEQNMLKVISDLDASLSTGNYVPIYEVRNKLGLGRKEFDDLLYKLQREDLIDVDTLQEAADFTSEQLSAGIEQPIGGRLFFLSTTDDGVAVLAKQSDNVSARGMSDPFIADDFYYGSPFLGGVDSPKNLPLGSSNPLRGAYPPGFAVISNDPKLARALAQGRVPDNTVLGSLTVQPAVDKVYLSPESIILDGNVPLPPQEFDRLMSKLSEFIDPNDRDLLRNLLKKTPKLNEAPLGRIMERLQEGWTKLYKRKAPNDLFFAALGSGYRDYVGRNGDAIMLNLPGNRTVLLTPNPGSALADRFQRTNVDVSKMVPSDSALHRAYADEVLAEPGGALSKVLGVNNRNQHALELTQELSDDVADLDISLDQLLDEESVLKAEEFAQQMKDKLEQAHQLDLAQSKSIDDEFSDLYEDIELSDFTDPGCL